MAFSVQVRDRNGFVVLAPTDVVLTPTVWSAAAMGGPVAADVELAGAADSLLSLAGWLGFGIEIWNEGGPVWWGQVLGLEVSANGVRRGLSIADVVNRVKLLYVRQAAGGTEEAAETGWSEDAVSVARYGKRERVYSAGTLTDSQAAGMVDVLLSRLATPQRTVRLDKEGVGRIGASGRLVCRGWFSRLDEVYYENPAGLEQHVVDNVMAWPLGLGFSSAYLGFITDDGNFLMQDVAGGLKNFRYDGLPVRVSGTARNDGTRTIASADGRDAVSYVSNAVSFGANDDLYDGNNGLSFIATDDIIWVSGASLPQNTGARRVETTGSSHIEVSTGWNSGFMDSGGVGPTVTILRGNGVKFVEATANEAPNGSTSETVTAWGQRIYQAFSLAANTTWLVDRIELRVRKIGSPLDALRVGLYLDSGGSPGTLIEQATLAAASVPTSEGWVTFSLAGTALLEYGTTYGLLVDRTGAMDAANYYDVMIDPDAGYARGAMRLYDGATWQAWAAGDLVFRVVGAVNALDLAVAVVSQAGTEISRSVVGASTNVEAWQYATGNEMSGAVVRRLLEQGDVDGRRLLATVTPDLALRVYAQPWDYDVWGRLDNGQPGNLDGAPLQDGVLPVGRWFLLGDVALLSDAWAGVDRIFVERASFRAGQGWDLEAEGQRSLLDRLGVQQG